MDSISNTVWQRKGSSIIFQRSVLGEIISQRSVLSLREALGWMKEIPDRPPIPGRTIIISGLETILETQSPYEAENFLSHRVRPLIIKLQNRWTNFGIVFGFSSHEKAFEETAFKEEVLFLRRDRKRVKLSEGLWDGSASVNMKRIVQDDTNTGNELKVGYYVARIS
jgi:hypothetical protein